MLKKLNEHETVAMRELLDAAALAATAGDAKKALLYQAWASDPKNNIQKIIMERLATLKNKPLSRRLKNAVNALAK